MNKNEIRAMDAQAKVGMERWAVRRIPDRKAKESQSRGMG
jgi:hypothetical protein